MLVPRVDEERKEVQDDMAIPESMQQLADRFMNDAQFREEMRRDPVEAADSSGLPLDEEDKQALRSIDWSGSDEQLNERVSKAYMRWC
jgi:hypothetical protein